MVVNTGDACRIFKRCKICREIKYVKKFQTTGGRKASTIKRKSFCRDCKDRRHEVIKGAFREYSFDTTILDVSKKITIRGRGLSGYQYEGIISCDKAKKLVEEGAAGVVHKTLIHKLFNRKSLRKFILERDHFTCHYCGFYGDTIDHKIPKSKGGASTPVNCVCACIDCNQNKKTVRYEEYVKQREIKRK
jgi:hypothetical protein